MAGHGGLRDAGWGITLPRGAPRCIDAGPGTAAVDHLLPTSWPRRASSLVLAPRWCRRRQRDQAATRSASAAAGRRISAPVSGVSPSCSAAWRSRSRAVSVAIESTAWAAVTSSVQRRQERQRRTGCSSSPVRPSDDPSILHCLPPPPRDRPTAPLRCSRARRALISRPHRPMARAATVRAGHRFHAPSGSAAAAPARRLQPGAGSAPAARLTSARRCSRKARSAVFAVSSIARRYDCAAPAASPRRRSRSARVAGR